MYFLVTSKVFFFRIKLTFFVPFFYIHTVTVVWLVVTVYVVGYMCVIFLFIVSISLRNVFIPISLLVVRMDFKTNARRYPKTHLFTDASLNSNISTRVNSLYGRGAEDKPK